MSVAAAMSGTAAILVAAGDGRRLGEDHPKAFVELGGQPLLVHAARALLAASSVGELVVVVTPGFTERAEGLLRSAAVPARYAVVEGGTTRSESVRAGLTAAGHPLIVAVHDAARPLVTPALVDACVAALVEPWEGVAPAIAVVDTLKQVDGDGEILRTVDRDSVWAVQTPQVFNAATLMAAHDHASVPATDDLALLEAMGARVRVVPGEHANLKVTYPGDLVVAAALLAARAGSEARA